MNFQYSILSSDWLIAVANATSDEIDRAPNECVRAQLWNNLDRLVSELCSRGLDHTALVRCPEE